MPMARIPPLSLVLAFALATTAGASDFPAFDFEGGDATTLPRGWRGGPPTTLFTDAKVFHGGSGSGRIERDGKSEGGFSTFTTSIPMDFAGSTIELHGWLRTEEVK